MKKWKRILAAAVIAIAIAVVMLPMSSVQALRKRAEMKLEVETECESEAEEELCGAQPDTDESRKEAGSTKQGTVEEESHAELEETQDTAKLQELPNEPEHNTDYEQTEDETDCAVRQMEEADDTDAIIGKLITADIKDEVPKGFLYEKNHYVKNVTHTVTFRINEAMLLLLEPVRITDIYESISYNICQITDNGEINLKEGLLEIPKKEEQQHINKIEAAYTQAGSYRIYVIGKRKQLEPNGNEKPKEIQIICHDFSIEKEYRDFTFYKDVQELDYGSMLYIDDLVNVKNANEYRDIEYEIKEQSGERNNILETGTENERTYIKAVGINSKDRGVTAITVQLKETPFTKASAEKTMQVHVNPVKLTIKTQADASKVYMHDTFRMKVEIQKDGTDITKQLMEEDKHLRIDLTIKSDKQFYKISTQSPNISIPVEKEYFKNYEKDAKYCITVNLAYDTDKKYIPYKADTAEVSLELLGRHAVLELSTDQNGIYDYRTYYKGTPAFLQVTLTDWTASQSKAEQTALAAEAENIVYHISSTDYDVVSFDNAKKYTAEDEKIPLCINGVGMAYLTVMADGSSAYTVQSSAIKITVENSPMNDRDFMISIENTKLPEKQDFCGDEKQTGFEKWQEYLDTCGGWINGSIKVDLTQTGKSYYNLLKLDEVGKQPQSLNQICISGDKKMEEYKFWMANSDTGAETKKSKDKENGIRTFRAGIDTTAPVIEDFEASADYYTSTSTEDRQYFPKQFVLTGSFTDATSGIAAIEYTTDMNAQNSVKWTTVDLDRTEEERKSFRIILGNGNYNAIAVRAVDMAGNVCDPVCLKNEKGAFIKVIVDDRMPEITVSAMTQEGFDTWQEYSAENENWTNKKMRFQISEKVDVNRSQTPDSEMRAMLYKVEYAYQSAADMLCNTPIDDDAWQELTVDAQGLAEIMVGSDYEDPVNKNGVYYFRGISESGVKSEKPVKKRILLWQKMAEKKTVMLSGADTKKCHNGWFNISSGTPVIDFAYPEYDTGVISGEYAAPIEIHYSLNVMDEKNITTLLVDNKTAGIRTDISEGIPENMDKNGTFNGFTAVSDDLSQLRANLSDDGIYTLVYWITDAAGNESVPATYTYQVDCHEPADLKLRLADEEQVIGTEKALVYEKFYQNSVSGEASADYGISGKGNITVLKAKRIGEWTGMPLTDDVEQFEIVPNMRGLLYVRAVDGAGNAAEGWTKGIVVDSEAPTGDGVQELIQKPEGANRHGFFNRDVKVKINIKDAPKDGNSSGLKLITGSAGTDGADTITDQELFSSTEESVSEHLMTETQGFYIVKTIDAKENEGNHAYITVNAADRCGNVSTDTRELKIDVTKPEIEITFDNDNAANGRYYNTDRSAKINIKELNFDASLVKISVTKNGSTFSPAISDWANDKNNHYAYIHFSEDGDYTLTVECKDLADNKADKVSAEPFTIDKTMPRVAIGLEDDNAQKEYVNTPQTVVITVTEHNFNADDFQINMQPGGKYGLWEHKNDTHVIKVELLSEGEHAISCHYKDMAGNEILAEDKAKMPFTLIIDTIHPEIEISGVENYSANSGEVIPVITVRDVNIEPETVSIALTTGAGIASDIRSDLTVTLTEGGFLYTLTGLNDKPDNIYNLTVTAADKAGNVSELTYRFSLNRRGSSYDLTDLTRLVDRYYNSYRNFEDIKIIEMNVDKVEEFALYMSHNANIVYGREGKRPLEAAQGKMEPIEAVFYDVDVSGSEDSGYIYTYTIYRENFASEGAYRLGIYSKDRAGNEVNNLLKQNGEEIQFIIDNTTPCVLIDGVESNEIYDVEAQEVRISVKDNFKLSEAWFTLVGKSGECLEQWDYFDLVENEGDTAIITIGARDEEVSLLYGAVDAAGNGVEILQGEETAKTDFLVTTDKLVQLVNKPAQTTIGRGMIVGMTLCMLGIVLFFAVLNKTFLKKRK